MSPRYDAEWVDKMLDIESRLGDISPDDLLISTGLRSDHTVADIGCGPGFLTLPAAVVVGPVGRVYAVDVEQRMLDIVNTQATQVGLENVLTVFSAGHRIPLPDQVADFAICGLLLHERSDEARRDDLVQDIDRITKPDGRILFVEHVPQSESDSSRRLTPEETRTILQRAGFESEGPYKLGDQQYAFVATRPVPETDSVQNGEKKSNRTS